MFRLTVLLISLLGFVASNSQTGNTNIADGPLRLSMLIKSLFTSLKNGKSGEQIIADLKAIVIATDSLLEESGYYPGQFNGIYNITKTEGSNIGAAVQLDGDFILLLQFGNSLKQAIESGNNGATIDSIIAIKMKAENIVKVIDELDIFFISFEIPPDNGNASLPR